MQRREFLKLAGASGVAIATARMHEPAVAKALHDQAPPVEAVQVAALEDDELVINLAEAYDFSLRIDENPRLQPAVGIIEAVPQFGRRDESLSVTIYADEEIRNWMLEEMQTAGNVRVIHEEIGLNRRLLVSTATLSVQNAVSDIMLELDGILLA